MVLVHGLAVTAVRRRLLHATGGGSRALVAAQSGWLVGFWLFVAGP
jgi:hypothetical protein